MRPEVAAFIRMHARDHQLAVLDDVAPYRELTSEERTAAVEAVCRAAGAILAARADRETVMALQDPPHPSYPLIVARLRVPWLGDRR